MKYESFEQFLSVSRGLQPITIAGYVGGVRRMKKVLGENPNSEKLNRYIHILYSSAYSYTYKTNTALALERWSEYKENPIRFGRQKKPRQIVKDTLTEAEITKLIFNASSLRDRTIIALLAYSGLRNLELCTLRVRDFDSGRNTIRVIRGKGIRDGLSNITGGCTKILNEYLKIYPREADDFLFHTYQRQQMSTCAVRKLVKVAARRADMAKRVYPHLLRHSLAANMLIRGAHVIALQKQLRHAWMETTLMYLNSIVFGDLSAYEKFAPSYL